MSDLLGAEGFVVGLIVALAVSAVMAAFGLRSRVAIVMGIGAVIGTLAGFVAEHRWSWSLVMALVILGAGAEVGAHRAGLLAGAAALPGALLLGAVLPDGVPNWGFPVATITAVVGTVLVVQFDRQVPRWLVPLLTLTALGVYAAVPDTEYARAFVGALVGTVVLTCLPKIRARAAIAAALGGLWAWASVAGGYARPASVVGAIGCLGVIAIAPLVIQTLAGLTVRAVAAVMTLQLAVVIVASRGAGLRSSVGAAIVIVAATWLATGFALLLLRKKSIF